MIHDYIEIVNIETVKTEAVNIEIVNIETVKTEIVNIETVKTEAVNIETVKTEAVKPHQGPGGPSQLRKHKKQHIYLWVTAVLCSVIVGTFILDTLYVSYQSHTPHSAPGSTQAASGPWTTYMAGNARSDFNATETTITPTTAPHLKVKWTHAPEGSFSSVVSQVVEANGLLYWGSWNGFEYATNANNQVVWSANLGSTTSINCAPPHLGVTSTAAIATILVNGIPTSVDFVGGGDDYLYALDAFTGTVIWKTQLGTPPAYYIWSSPAVYNGSIYMGISSDCDLPLIRGGLAQLDATTGKILHTFYTVPPKCLGASVWTSPAIDEAVGTLYFATGNGGDCANNEPYGEALIELRASDLSLLHSWQLPKDDAPPDADFPGTPTLFSTTTGTPMVGLANKNGTYYAFKRDDLHKPVWKSEIATNVGIQSSSAWDGHRLYIAGENAVVDGVHCHASMMALNPNTGTIIWQHCINSGTVFGAVSAAPGLVVYAIGKHVIVLDATSGQVLYLYETNSSHFWGWSSISNGVLYVGSTDGTLYAFAP